MRAPVVHRLGDGRAVELRPVVGSDGAALSRLLGAASDHSVQRRFLSPRGVVERVLATRVRRVDDSHHVVRIAVLGEEIVGHAELVRSDARPDRAELAVWVADELHGMGLGRALSEAMAVDGAAAGIEVLTMAIAAQNRAAASLVRSLGARLRLDDGLLEGEMAVAPIVGTAGVRLRGAA